MKKSTKWLMIPCAAMALTMGSALVSFAATGWTEENGEWAYYDSEGTKRTDVFVKSGENWFYMDSDGKMVKDALVENGENYYYMNADGAMVTNEWRAIDNENAGDDEPDQWWYYFQSNGKAMRKTSSGDNAKFISISSSSGMGKYAFDEEGRMQFGWLDESGAMITGDDAWRSGVYYCGDNGDGRMSTGWKYITAENDDDSDREGDGYWFYFSSNGKKIADDDNKKINGRRYSFDEYGAAQFDWYDAPSTSSGSNAGHRYYNTEDKCWVSTGWFKAIPSEDVDAEAHDNDEAHWFYAESDGDLVKAQIKRINGQSYGFDVNGKMLSGLYKIEFESDGRTITSAEKIEDENNIPDETETDVHVYYFGNSPKEGALKTGSATIEIDGEKYNYNFAKSGSKKGAGIDGVDGDSIYIKGRRLEAEEGSKYQPITYKGETYLISTSGKLAKNRKNIKDADDVYYKTDSKGRIIESDTEKLP